MHPTSRELAFEGLLWVFFLSFVYAALSFTFEHSALATGISWFITAFLCFLYIMATRVHRGARAACFSKEHFERAVSQQVFKFFGIVMLAFAVLALCFAAVGAQSLDVNSDWMTMIACLMASKWSFILHRFIRIYIMNEAENSTSQSPLIGQA